MKVRCVFLDVSIHCIDLILNQKDSLSVSRLQGIHIVVLGGCGGRWESCEGIYRADVVQT